MFIFLKNYFFPHFSYCQQISLLQPFHRCKEQYKRARGLPKASLDMAEKYLAEVTDPDLRTDGQIAEPAAAGAAPPPKKAKKNPPAPAKEKEVAKEPKSDQQKSSKAPKAEGKKLVTSIPSGPVNETHILEAKRALGKALKNDTPLEIVAALKRLLELPVNEDAVRKFQLGKIAAHLAKHTHANVKSHGQEYLDYLKRVVLMEEKN